MDVVGISSFFFFLIIFPISLVHSLTHSLIFCHHPWVCLLSKHKKKSNVLLILRSKRKGAKKKVENVAHFIFIIIIIYFLVLFLRKKSIHWHSLAEGRKRKALKKRCRDFLWRQYIESIMKDTFNQTHKIITDIDEMLYFVVFC